MRRAIQQDENDEEDLDRPEVGPDDLCEELAVSGGDSARVAGEIPEVLEIVAALPMVSTSCGDPPQGSNAKIRFQSFFMLITVQPFDFASA